MDALISLLEQVQGFRYDSEAFAGVVLSLTGFYGQPRALLRQLAACCRLRLEPALIQGMTTHLVCASPAAAQRSEKLAKAQAWGIPIVSLAWLLDSISEGGPLPVEGRYRVHLLPTAQQISPGEQQQQQQQQRRPSSVASSKDPAVLGQQQRQACKVSPANPVLNAVENLMVAELRRVSISAKPQMASGSVIAKQQQQQQPPTHQQQEGMGKLQMEYDGSPDQSLSFRHLVGAVDAQSCSPDVVSSGLAGQMPGGLFSKNLEHQSASPLPRTISPMLISPCHAAARQEPSPKHSLGSDNELRHSRCSSPSDCSMGTTSSASTPLSPSGKDATTPASSSRAMPSTARVLEQLGTGKSACMLPSLGTALGPMQDHGQLGRQQEPGQHQPRDWPGMCEASTASGLQEPIVASPHDLFPPRGLGDNSPGMEQLIQEHGGGSIGAAGMTPCAAVIPSASKADASLPLSSESLQLPPINYQCITSRRPHHHREQQPEMEGEQGVGARADAAAAGLREEGVSKKKAIQDWSDEDSVGFPTPPDPRLRRKAAEEEAGPAIIARVPPAVPVMLPLKGDKVAVKLLQRPPRGNCVREHHGLANLKQVQFAEQVSSAGLVLSTKDKKTAVKLRLHVAVGGREPSSSDDDDNDFQQPNGSALAVGEALGEAQTFYRLSDGRWWLEYSQLYTAEQAEQLAAERGIQLVLPRGYDRANELLRSTERQCTALDNVAGTVTVRRVKQGGTMLKLKGGAAATAASSRSYFWRTALDPATMKCVTDRPSKDFVATECLP